MINIKKIAVIFIITDLLLILYSFIEGNHWLINSQSAFVSSVLVTFASFLGYKKMVQKKIEIGDIPKEDRDELDIIEDAHDLYGEDRDLREVIKEERAKIAGFKNSALNLGKSASGALSAFRLFAYAVLTLSFLYLNRHGMLNIAGFLTGLAIVPIVATFSVLFIKE